VQEEAEEKEKEVTPPARRTRRAGLIALLTATACLWGATTAGAKMYFLDVIGDKISVVNSTGQITSSNFIRTGRSFEPCCTMEVGSFGLATDGPHIYWSNKDEARGINSSIGRATLDSTGKVVDGSVNPVFAPLPGVVWGIDLELQPDGSSFLFWAHRQFDGAAEGIGRMEIDPEGEVVEDSIDPNFITGVSNILYVAADGQNLFWNNAGTDSIGHARFDADGNLVGTPNPQAIPSGDDAPMDPASQADVMEPSGLVAEDGFLYWGNDERKYPGHPGKPVIRGGGTSIGRVAIDETGAPVAPAEGEYITGEGSLQPPGVSSGAQKPNGLATDGAYLYWGNGDLPVNQDADDIGRAPLDDPMGPGFRFSFVRSPFTSSIVVQRDATVEPDCPTSKEPVATCTITVTDPLPMGANAPMGTVEVSASGTGTWSPEAECLLSPAGPNTSTCVLEYTRESDRGELITATYRGDEKYAAAEGDSPLLPIPVDPEPPVQPPILPTLPSNPKHAEMPGPGAKKKCKKGKTGKKGKKKRGKKCRKKKRKN
jgi:hypothetical protein